MSQGLREPTREEWAMWASAIEKPRPLSSYELLGSLLGMGDWRGAQQASEAQIWQWQPLQHLCQCQCSCHRSLMGSLVGGNW